MSNSGAEFALGYVVGEQLARAPWEAAQAAHAEDMALAARKSARDLSEAYDMAMQAVEMLKAQVANLTQKLALEQCTSKGLAALVEGYKAENPSSALASGSGVKYDDGSEKTIGRVTIYEPAFRQHAVVASISIPDRYLD
jgi:hypothetical protein